MAGGSQIKINKQGITITTNGKVLYHAREHIFGGEREVRYELPKFPKVIDYYSNKLDVFNLFNENGLKNIKYSMLNGNGEVQTGVLDEYGRTERIRSAKKENIKVLIGGDEWHYYIDQFGGTRRDHTVIQFVDHLGEPIEDLEFQLSDEDGNVFSRGMTDEEGAALFLSPNIEFPLLWVKKLELMSLSL